MTSARLAVAVAMCAIGSSLTAARQAPQSKTPERFGIGRAATPEEIAAWDIDVRPDGVGLPPGSGTPGDGTTIYAAKCSGCHGKTGREGPNDRLVGRLPNDTLVGGGPIERLDSVRTIKNFWPYSTTVFDYIRRAMPPDAPGSLKDNEVYALTAYLLYLNDLVSLDATVDATSLPKVKMPARDRFVPDPRGGPKSVPKK